MSTVVEHAFRAAFSSPAVQPDLNVCYANAPRLRHDGPIFMWPMAASQTGINHSQRPMSQGSGLRSQTFPQVTGIPSATPDVDDWRRRGWHMADLVYDMCGRLPDILRFDAVDFQSAPSPNQTRSPMTAARELRQPGIRRSGRLSLRIPERPTSSTSRLSRSVSIRLMRSYANPAVQSPGAESVLVSSAR